MTTLVQSLLISSPNCLKSVCQGIVSTEANPEYRFNYISVCCWKLLSDLPCPVGSKKSELFIPISAYTCNFIKYTLLFIHSGTMKFSGISCWLSTLWFFTFCFLTELVISISFSRFLPSSIHKLEITAPGSPFLGYLLWHLGLIQVALPCSYRILVIITMHWKNLLMYFSYKIIPEFGKPV